jgi:sulfopropanediol 3-dehydrogenase
MVEFLKSARKKPSEENGNTMHIVSNMLKKIELGGEDVVKEFAQKFDNFFGVVPVSQEQIFDAEASLSDEIKEDIAYARENVKKFALAQKNSINDFQVEIRAGLLAGQKSIPLNSAGCYVPGGRYSHIASAIMTVTTAKMAGVKHISVCSPPRNGKQIPNEIIYAASSCGANSILTLGGVQGVASLAFGLFDVPSADIIVGPGNQFVAEAKRLLFGRIGIDMIAGPTDSLIIADSSADPMLVATDLVSQAEHGYNSPVWLLSNNRMLCEDVLKLVPSLISTLPLINKKNANEAWNDYAEVILCKDREEIALESDKIAPEHLSIHADKLDWWLGRLTAYGSLFLGEETTVSFGDKVSGPNHVLPTSGSARYTGGLSVHNFQKIVTWQSSTKDAAKEQAIKTARISRTEGMEGHARAADIRLKKFFPDQTF